MLPISVLSVLIVIFGNISGIEDFSFNKERYSKLRRLVASDVAIENGISIITTEPPIKQFFKWDVTATNFNNNSLELTTVNSDIKDNIIVNERKPTKIRKRKRKGRRRRRKFRKTTTIAPNFQSDQTELNANSTATVRVKNRRRNRKQRKNRKNRRKNRLQNPSILEITTARNKNLPVVSTSIKDLIQKLNDNPEESFEEKHFNSTVLKVPDIESLNTTKTINLHVNMGTNSTRKLHTRNRNNRCSKNNGNCAHICHPKGPQKCSCSYGFVLSSDNRNCLDVDECSMNNGGCEMNCKNTLGSYNCYCSSGYRLTDDLLSCEDVNECLLRNGHGPCHGNCENTFGSYKCNCKNLNGTKLGNDGHSCVDIDECAEGKSGCSHNCINALGRSYCTCPEGLELSSDWKTCQDLNECDDEFIRDSCNGECINTDGSYTCLSHGEYQNDQALNDLYQVTCKPLFPPKHGFYTCSRKGALQTYTKSGRKRIKNSPGTTCKLECPVGYKLFGQLHVTCDFFGIWRGKLTGKCLPAREPVIKCPANQTLLLPKGSKKVLVKFPSPQTNIHWKYVKSNPVWAKNLNGELNDGIHSIVFLVKDPTSKLITTCSFTITVYDDEK